MALKKHWKEIIWHPFLQSSNKIGRMDVHKLKAISDELEDVNRDLDQINQQIGLLKQQKSSLLSKKNNLERQLNTCQDTFQDTSEWESEKHPWSDGLRNALRHTFGLTEYRPLQLSAMNIVLSGLDCLLIMSTGGGKSLCYQLPAVFSKGITLVVSPLLSLIEDQIIHLEKLGVHAVTLNQNSTKEEVKSIHDALTDPKSSLRILYVTPEKLAKSKRIMNKLEKCAEMKILKLIAIDEIHCVSQWGHDFRPDYKFLNILKRQFKGVPILGLTATATANVLEDVKATIGIQGATTLRASFNRPNLFYEVRPKPAGQKETLEELARVIRQEFAKESGIIYCFSRKECEEVAQDLRKNGIKAAYYHAYLEADQRRKVHEKWLSGECTVIVATVAFGMGIDKPDVRFVIHHSLAKSMENYYQESGRAGRDGKPAKCILYYKLADVFRQSTMVCAEKTGVSNLYSMLTYAVKPTQCRRVCISSHFDESWDDTWCNQMCDFCVGSAKESGEAVDVSKHLLQICEIIEQQKSASEQGRITGNKLAELFLKKATDVDQNMAEEIIARLLLESYLQEDFHFTPYAIISYVAVSGKTNRWMENQRPILLHISSPNSPQKKVKNARKLRESEEVIEINSKSAKRNKKDKKGVPEDNDEIVLE
ncbi:DEAD/DEAH box helicase domain-containing protein [Ditylenchus destructor]|uniref:ATP-dependent DNA helicase n=1 Tax=Ditylenchus destructor TaxID=166010 RepID=A0AAD4R5P5_9BILA|nr:DEAD/DEAH box helicase domain-containing protein [Ditylenchus destructor]